jgi:hypothetical protein
MRQSSDASISTTDPGFPNLLILRRLIVNEGEAVGVRKLSGRCKNRFMKKKSII